MSVFFDNLVDHERIQLFSEVMSDDGKRPSFSKVYCNTVIVRCVLHTNFCDNGFGIDLEINNRER